MRKLWLAAMTAAFLAGCSTEPEVEQPEPPVLRIRVDVAPRYAERLPVGCESRVDGEGTNVTVRDAAGVTIGVGALKAGIVQKDGACHLDADIATDASSTFYEIQIGAREPSSLPAETFDSYPRVPLRIGY